ncbi:hypothetical protein N7455_005998 [Penicillium solitum]|uniref:uncharacterized protein n=1 Tax=Penicillium solitum TaxID=60172 RepID=UPI0018533090|nr:hypothetical protein HAV15_012384 [Penicillium sp. str. \
MATRTIYLISARNKSFQRAHFSIFVPSATNPDRETKIHAVGAPMAGYVLEFKRNYNPSLDPHDQTFPIGQVHSSDIVDSPDAAPSIDSTPRGKIELAATQIQTPGINQNFMTPVNDTANKRCQEWTMEYVRHLVAKGLIDEKAIEIVQSKRDSPTHGIGLRSVTRLTT